MDARVSIGGCLLLGAIGVTAAVRHDWSTRSPKPGATADGSVVLRLFKGLHVQSYRPRDPSLIPTLDT